ncbi:MAG TPA: adenylate/guanylate cyclase domain-containing protein, partial [Gammaproteobacteria bacterium]|nr:adenylate/guanylate cyclase domain-containing protein [Gammaproteobacteria bacterium]
MQGSPKIKTNHIKIGLIFAVFVLFLSSAIGLLEINVISGLRVSVNSQVADNILILTYRISSLDTALFIIIGIALSVCLPVLGPVKSSLLTIIAIIVLYFIGKLSSNQYDLIPFEYFTLMILMLYIVNILISYFIEIHSKQKILATFGQYLPPHIVNKISSGMEQLALEGEARQMTVLFCDIQSFTSISEELNPKQLSKLLNEYFTSLSKILFRYNATIDKFIGDSIMAFWGAPLEQDDQADRAVSCALDMIMEIERLSENFRLRGWPGPAAGIGINSGLMAVGNMGSVYRMAYTVIGDAVNVASRAESLTRTY